MAENTTPKAPSGLGLPARRMWKGVVAGYELTTTELELLGQACRVLDTIARMEAALADEPMIVAGSTGQPKANPLGREIREERLLLARLLDQIGLPTDAQAGAWDGLTASHRARKAARARWSTPYGA